MKTLITKFILLCLCAFLSSRLCAQDMILTNLTTNPVLIEKYNQINTLRNAAAPDTIGLGSTGIIDDFSYEGPYPNSNVWLDNFVFINRTYAYSPPTIGVATFDGLNQKGYPYNFSADQNSSRLADYLTSKPIDLAYPAGDSIYLSFYYQPQGLGNSPASRDSLVLEFKSPSDTTWNWIWSKPGSSIVFKDTSSWNIVMVPITNPDYLKRGFQFRFKNYATVSGNLDHWNLDYVYLSRFRKITNTNFQDVSFVYNHPTLLKKYYTMPWRQYIPALCKSEVTTLIRNNHTTPKTVSTVYTIKDSMGTVLFTIPFNSRIISPFSQTNYFNDVITPIPAFPALTGPTRYFAEEVLSSAPDLNLHNDTLRYEQKFGNYFSYDDGTAESAYGLTQLNAQLAIKYELNVPDSLRYVDIYFNPILVNAADYSFNLKVWADDGGIPGQELASSRELKPRYSMGSQNNIIRYGMDAALGLPAGVFYVGFVQNTNKPLNIGLDLNNNNQFNTFYNLGKGWNTAPYPGTPILHPVFGKDSAVMAITEITDLRKLLGIYPNPATRELNLYASDFKNHKFTYSITDVFGKEVESNIFTTPATIDISALAKGIYFMHVTEGNTSSTLKFMKLE